MKNYHIPIAQRNRMKYIITTSLFLSFFASYTSVSSVREQRNILLQKIFSNTIPGYIQKSGHNLEVVTSNHHEQLTEDEKTAWLKFFNFCTPQEAQDVIPPEADNRKQEKWISMLTGTTSGSFINTLFMKHSNTDQIFLLNVITSDPATNITQHPNQQI